MSDPYGSNSGSNPYGQSPYGQQPPAPSPYGGGGGYGGGPQGFGGSGNGFGGQPPKTDGVSIASFVLSLLCCTGLIGLILGFVGLSRTKNGQRKGRGFAIAGIVLGVLSLFVVAGGIIFLVYFANTLVTPDNAKVGQCIDTERDGSTVLLTKAECTEEHDAEVVAVVEVTDENRDDIANGMAVYCITAIAEEDQEAVTPYLSDLDAVIEDPDDVSVGDTLVCYVEPSGKLSDPIL